jgi:D-glycero-D-manno-heptose 1,7-bisphosphate phosphatase
LTLKNEQPTPKRAAVFLDRDGTINVEKNYLHKIEDFEFIPGAPQAIKRLKDAGFLVVVVSNQAGVARGYFDEAAVRALHEHIQAELAFYGTSVDAFYFCPHHPEEGVGAYKVSCNCRKGEPGMLLQAAEEHKIDLGRSYMVGDKLADTQAGLKAGCRPFMVMTGYGHKESGCVLHPAVLKFPSLVEAVEYILSPPSTRRGFS